MLPLSRSLCHTFLRNSLRNPIGMKRSYSTPDPQKSIFSRIAEQSPKIPTIPAKEIVSNAANKIKETALHAKENVEFAKDALGDAKGSIVKTIKLGRVVITICAIFFTIDFVLKSTASICESSEKIYENYKKISKIKKIEE